MHLGLASKREAWYFNLFNCTQTFRLGIKNLSITLQSFQVNMLWTTTVMSSKFLWQSLMITHKRKSSCKPSAVAFSSCVLTVLTTQSLGPTKTCTSPSSSWEYTIGWSFVQSPQRKRVVHLTLYSNCTSFQSIITEIVFKNMINMLIC